MKVTKTVKHHINMGHFEWMEVSATADIETEEWGDDAMAEIDLVINETLRPELKKAYEATDEQSSYVNEIIRMEK